MDKVSNSVSVVSSASCSSLCSTDHTLILLLLLFALIDMAKTSTDIINMYGKLS